MRPLSIREAPRPGVRGGSFYRLWFIDSHRPSCADRHLQFFFYQLRLLITIKQWIHWRLLMWQRLNRVTKCTAKVIWQR